MSENPHEEFLSLYKPIHAQLVRYCASSAYGLMETEDLMQETLLQTMQNFNQLKDKNKLLYFMMGVAGNIVKNNLRRKKFSAELSDRQLQKLEAMVSDPALAIDVQYLYKALNKLPVKMKEAIVLFEISGMSMKEISHIQQTSESAVKTMISRGRYKLKDLLAEDKMAYEVSPGKTIFSLIL